MKIQALSSYDMDRIRGWRDEAGETLRTPYLLTKEMQQDYYRNVICNRDSRTRYWAFVEPVAADDDNEDWERDYFYDLIGYGGLENIEWENSRAEISLLIAPDRQCRGYGREAVGIILDQAFKHLNLHSVHGECYECAAVEFWQKMVAIYEKLPGIRSMINIVPHTKYWKGQYYDSFYFTFIKGE